MPDPKIETDEAARLAALTESGLLDSQAEEAFDRLTRLASRILGVPVSLISLVDDHRQFFKSQTGLAEPWASARETPLSHSFCQHVVASREPLIVEDARLDPLLTSNRAIADLGVVAYAGVPLTTADGLALGSFCAIDSKPHQWTADELLILKELAASVMTEMELKLAARQALVRAAAAERESNERIALLESTTEGIVGIDLAGNCTFVNRAAAEMLGWEPDDLTGLPMHETFHHTYADGSPYPASECSVLEVRTSGREIRHAPEHFWRKDGTRIDVDFSASPVRLHGDVSGAVLTFVDTTERRRSERRSQIQHAVSVVLAEASHEEEAWREMLSAVGRALDWKLGTLWLVDGAAGLLRSRAAWRAGERYEHFERVTASLTWAPDAGLPGKVWKRGEPAWEIDISRRPDLPRAEAAGKSGLRGAILFPIRGSSGVLGVAEFITDRLEVPDPLLLPELVTIGNQVGQYIERKRAEEEVRRSEALNSSILAAAIDCVISMAGDGTIREWNAAAERTFGYPRAEVIGKPMHEVIIPPSLRAAHCAGLARYLATGEGPVIDRRIEITGVRRDGTEFPLELAVTRIPLDGPPMFTGYLRDITERKRTQEALTEQVRLSSLAAEVGLMTARTSELEPMLQACAESLVRWLDAAFARIWMLNAEGDVLELKASAGLYTHRDGPHARVHVGQLKIGRIAASRRPHLTNHVLEDPAVDAKWAAEQGLVSFAGLPLLVDDRLVGVMAVFARTPLPDATLKAMASVANAVAMGIERKRALDALEIAKQAAEAANVAKSRFLANMSHELRTPLNAVILYSELLQEEAEDRGVTEFVPDLEKIRRAGRHLLSLINNVLDLAKVEAGRMDLNPEPFDLRAELDDVLITIQPLLSQNDNSLDLQVAADVDQMYADVTKVRQILINLVSNAAKFTEHGTVTLQVTSERVGDGREFVFRVQDTGIGMSPAELARLFQPFSQADESVTRKYGGTGLGLNLCREFAELMGGTIGVESEVGRGTTFTVRLPARMAAAVPAAEVQGSVLVDGCALVIDDDPAARRDLVRALAEQGVAAVQARSGQEGLDLAHSFRPGIIFLDVMMPGMDGWAVLTALKADPGLCQVPVVLLSLSPREDLGYLLGADEYLVKPLDPERVVPLLAKYKLLRNGGAALIVDDDEATRAVVRKLLRRDGWTVEEAEDGRAALERLANSRIVLVLLDLIMPKMDGFEFLSTMRQQPAWRDIPVMVMTSKDLTRDDRARLSGRVEAIVRKGVHGHTQVLQEIRDIVRRHLRKPDGGLPGIPAITTD